MQHSAEELIQKLGLLPHAEGGWYSFVWRSAREIAQDALPACYSGPRMSCSMIHYMLKAGEESRWHRLCSAEVWAWHAGGSLEMTLGGSGDAPAAEKKLLLGPGLERGERFQVGVPEHMWQTSRVTAGAYVLVTCIVAPSYDDNEWYMP